MVGDPVSRSAPARRHDIKGFRRYGLEEFRTYLNGRSYP